MAQNFHLPLPSATEIRERLFYDPDSGHMYWRPRPVSVKQHQGWNTKFAGTRAGWLRPTDNSYFVSFEQGVYPLHRLIWVWMTGREPSHHVDHIDRDRSNNRWDNLREASSQENNVNVQPRAGTSGYRNVVRNKHGYTARCCRNGRIARIGTYETLEEAALMADVIRKALFGQFHRPEPSPIKGHAATPHAG